MILIILLASNTPKARAFSLQSLEEQGFRCSGATCIGRLPGAYPEEVAFIIPSSFREPSPGNYILHLVGNYDADVDFKKDVLDRFRLDQLLEQAGRTEIMIVPANRGPRLTHREEFMCSYLTIHDKKLWGTSLRRCQQEGQRRFDRFMAAAIGVLRKAGLATTARIGRLVLSGHSGAYAPMAAILQNPAFKTKIHEVYCFDCMYGEEDVFARYARHSPPDRFLSVALRGDRTDLGQFRIWSSFHETQTQRAWATRSQELENILTETDTDERQRLLNLFDRRIQNQTSYEKETADEPKDPCAAAWAVFASSTPDHDATVTRYFPRFLKLCSPSH